MCGKPLNWITQNERLILLLCAVDAAPPQVIYNQLHSPWSTLDMTDPLIEEKSMEKAGANRK